MYVGKNAIKKKLVDKTVLGIKATRNLTFKSKCQNHDFIIEIKFQLLGWESSEAGQSVSHLADWN